MTYSPQVLDHFGNPRNAGELEGATAAVQLENPVCGDALKLWGRVTQDRLDITFKAKGCVSTVACASAMTEMVKGKPLGEARAVTREMLVESLGGLSATTMHASHLAFDTLQALLKQLK